MFKATPLPLYPEDRYTLSFVQEALWTTRLLKGCIHRGSIHPVPSSCTVYNLPPLQQKYCEDDKINSDIVIRTYVPYGRHKRCVQSFGRKYGSVESAWRILRSQKYIIKPMLRMYGLCVWNWIWQVRWYHRVNRLTKLYNNTQDEEFLTADWPSAAENIRLLSSFSSGA